MQPVRSVYVAAQAITPFIGKGHPDFISKGHADFGKRQNPSLEEHLAAVLHRLFAEAAWDPRLIERGFVGNFAGSLFSQQAHLGAMLARVEPRLAGIGVGRLEAACASGGIALVSAAEAIQAGLDVVLVCGAEVQTTVSARQGADYLARAAHYASERAIDDFTFPALLTRRTKAYKARYGLSDRDLARVSVKAYANANRNPLAHMHHVQLGLEQAATASDTNPNFLSHEELKPHLRMSDCSQVSDGAAALILVSEEGLRKLGLAPADTVRLRAYGFATDALGRIDDPLTLSTAARAANEALTDASLTADAIQVAEVHDCFTIAEVMMYEAIGWAQPGRGAQLVADGETSLEGRIPVNTGGGLIGFGHPVGATGIKQVAEVFRQMKGHCGAYQVRGDLVHGLTVNMGGDDRTVVASVLENVH